MRVLLVFLSHVSVSISVETFACKDLSKFQYFCEEPVINPDTQQPASCRSDNSITLECRTSLPIKCKDAGPSGYFNVTVENACDYKAHKSYSTAVLLTIFCGILGIDRLYLGYYAIGLFKMFTFGGILFFWIIDVVLIVLQNVGPADGTSYIIAYFGPKAEPSRFNAETTYNSISCFEC